MSIELKAGQLWLVGESYYEIVDMTGSIVTLRVTPKNQISTFPKTLVEWSLEGALFLGYPKLPEVGQVYKDRSNGILSRVTTVKPSLKLVYVKAPGVSLHPRSVYDLMRTHIYLGDMPKVGEVFERKGFRTEVLGFDFDLVKVPQFEHPTRGAWDGILLESLLTKFKKVEVEQPLPDSVFLNPKTGAVLRYSRRGNQQTLTDLVTGVRMVFHAKQQFDHLKLIGIHPQVGDRFEDHGREVRISRFEKDRVFFDIDSARLYGRESYISLVDLLEHFEKIPPSTNYEFSIKIPKTEEFRDLINEIKNVCKIQERSEGYLGFDEAHEADTLHFIHINELQKAREQFAHKVNFKIALDKMCAAIENCPHLNMLRDWNLMPTGRIKTEPVMVGFPTQMYGRLVRARENFMTLDFADADRRWSTFCNKHHRDSWPTLMPQIDDVYVSKFNGIEVRVIKVRRTGYTVTDGRRKWKVNSQALAINYKWVR